MLKYHMSSGLMKGPKVEARELHGASPTSNKPQRQRNEAPSRNGALYAAAEV